MSGLLHQENPRTLHGPSNCTSRHSDFGNHSQSTVCLWFGCITDKPVPQFFLRLLFLNTFTVLEVLRMYSPVQMSANFHWSCFVWYFLLSKKTAEQALYLCWRFFWFQGLVSLPSLTYIIPDTRDHISPHLALLALNTLSSIRPFPRSNSWIFLKLFTHRTLWNHFFPFL